MVRRGLLAALAAIALVPSAASGRAGAPAVALGCDPLALAGPAPAAARVSEEAALGGVVEPNVEQAYERVVAHGLDPATRRARASGPVRVPVFVHVVQPSAGVGVVPAAQIASQVTVLNDSFGGSTGGDNSGFVFELVDTDVTVNPTWNNLEPDTPQEVAMKTTLREGGARALNIYVVDLTAGLLGWATFPEEYAGNSAMDGVVVEKDSLPGGSLSPYNLGDTATHEVGHWFGLFHTFQGGCGPPGDLVEDTEPEEEPHFDCLNSDSCPGGASDPVDNFMSYADDACMFRFTPGQGNRMHDETALFRNGAPVASGQAISASPGEAVPVTVEASDPDGDQLSFSVGDPPGHGTIGGSGAALTYTASRDYTGPDSFTVRATDVFGAAATATVSVDVEGLRVTAKAKRKQRLKRLTVSGGCGSDECKVVATGKIVARAPGDGKVARAARTFKLKRISGQAQPNDLAKLRLRVAKSKRRLLRLLEDGWRAKAKVTVTATGPSGDESAQKTSIVVTL